MSQEIELKLLLDDAAYDRLRDRLGEPSRVLQQRNVYFEDAEQPSLWASHGIAVRLRETAEQWVLTLKGAGRVEKEWTQRPEFERRLETPEADALLEGGDELTRACVELFPELPEVLRRSRLRPRGELRNERQLFEGVLGEAVLELDRFQLPDGSIHRELEVEWHGEAEAARATVTENLRLLFAEAKIPWQPSSVSKRERFERALEEGSP